MKIYVLGIFLILIYYDFDIDNLNDLLDLL